MRAAALPQGGHRPRDCDGARSGPETSAPPPDARHGVWPGTRAPRARSQHTVCPLHRWVHITCPWGISRGTHVHAAAGRAGQAAGT